MGVGYTFFMTANALPGTIGGRWLRRIPQADAAIERGDTLGLKTGVMLDDVKWSADTEKIQTELKKKITKNNQIMTAIERVVNEYPEIAQGISRVIPVFVVLDPCFASPGLEEVVNSSLVKPDLECEIELKVPGTAL
jgi:hypothetical protein